MPSRQSGLLFWGSTENFHFETWRCPLWTLYTIKHFRKMENAWTGERGPCRMTWWWSRGQGIIEQEEKMEEHTLNIGQQVGGYIYREQNKRSSFLSTVQLLILVLLLYLLAKEIYHIKPYHEKLIYSMYVWSEALQASALCVNMTFRILYVLYIGGCCPCTALPYIPNSEVLRTNNSFEGDSLEGK